MSLTSKLLLGAALALIVSACGNTSSDRTASASPPPDLTAPPPGPLPPPGAPTAPSSASSSASSKDMAMAGGPSATTPPPGKADLSGPAKPGGPAGAAEGPGAPPPMGIALSEIKNPRTALKGAMVKDSKGEAIGEVKSVKVGKDGKAVAVNVAAGAKTVTLKADALTYAEADKSLIAAQTKEELVK